MVVEKPPGMLSVPGRGPEKQDCAAARIGAMFPEATGPLTVHRLDMETSGLMVLALDAEAHRELSMQFERRVVEKAYIALVAEPEGAGVSEPIVGSAAAEGDPLDQDEGTVALPMRCDIDDRPRQIVDFVHGRPAMTTWQVLLRETDRIRLRMVPETGRTHQLRIHAAYGLGRPIVGDVLYGGDRAARLMLHSAYLSFLEPGTMRRADFESRAPF